MAEYPADLLVLPRRHQLEMPEEALDDLHARGGAPQETVRGREVLRLDEPGRLLGLDPGVLQPELGGLMDGLEEQLIAVSPLVRALLQREQLVGSQIALVVARRRAGQDRRELVWLRLRHGVSLSAVAARSHGAPSGCAGRAATLHA